MSQHEELKFLNELIDLIEQHTGVKVADREKLIKQIKKEGYSVSNYLKHKPIWE